MSLRFWVGGGLVSDLRLGKPEVDDDDVDVYVDVIDDVVLLREKGGKRRAKQPS